MTTSYANDDGTRGTNSAPIWVLVLGPRLPHLMFECPTPPSSFSPAATLASDVWVVSAFRSHRTA